MAKRVLRSYQDRVETVSYQLIPIFGNKTLDGIIPEDVEAFRRQRKLRNGKQPSVQTINNDHAILKHMLSVAERKGLVQQNVARKVRMPDPQNERDRVLSEDEWQRLIEVAAPHIKPVLILVYHLGMRLGEILRLTWNRVDLERGFIRLAAWETKSGKPRLVPMTPGVQEILRALSKVKSLVTNWVFLYKGKPLGEIKTSVKTAIKLARIQDFRFHDLRHCAATNLRRAGVDTVTAMKIVGHQSDKMHRRYNNVNEADLLLAASTLNPLMTPTVFSASPKIVNH